MLNCPIPWRLLRSLYATRRQRLHVVVNGAALMELSRLRMCQRCLKALASRVRGLVRLSRVGDCRSSPRHGTGSSSAQRRLTNNGRSSRHVSDRDVSVLTSTVLEGSVPFTKQRRRLPRLASERPEIYSCLPTQMKQGPGIFAR